jgi:hypothetical protein
VAAKSAADNGPRRRALRIEHRATMAILRP